MKKICILILALLFLNPTAPIWAGWKLTSKPVKLISGEGQQFMQPVWSPDDNWIAFTSSAYKGIWIKHTKNGQMKQISNESAAGFGFKWSHSSEAIAIRAATYRGSRRVNSLQIIEIASGQHRVVPTSGRLRGLPHWSGDDQLIFISNDNELQQFQSGEKSFLAAQNPAHISYLNQGKIVINNTSSNKEQTIEPLPNERCINLSISPDSRKLAFEIVGGDLYVINVDGTGLVNLGTGFRPQWAPNSNSLVYMISEDDGHGFTASDIYIVNSDGSEKSQLTKTRSTIEMNPSWSPDGKKIAFDSNDSGEIYVVTIEELEEK